MFVWHVPVMSQQPVGQLIALHGAAMLPLLGLPLDPLLDPVDEPLDESSPDPVSVESSPPPSAASSPFDPGPVLLDWMTPASP